MIKEYTVDLLVSHNQIRLENRPFIESLCEWGRGNLNQGCIIHDGFVVFDPILEGSFGANVHLLIVDVFEVDKDCVRCIQTSFNYNSNHPLKISSAFESFVIRAELGNGNYNLYFEVVEAEEVFYRLTLVKSYCDSIISKYLKDDEFGGAEGMVVELGKVD